MKRCHVTNWKTAISIFIRCLIKRKQLLFAVKDKKQIKLKAANNKSLTNKKQLLSKTKNKVKIIKYKKLKNNMKIR